MIASLPPSHAATNKSSVRLPFWGTLAPAVLMLVAAAGCDPGAGRSESTAYPARPIQLVVPFGAGGGTDTFARIMKRALEEHRLLPQPLVIVNQGGAGATIGSRSVKDAEPDGYTVLILHDAIITAKYAGTVEYGPEAFEPIAGTGEVGMFVAVEEHSPFRNLTELMDAARRRPQEITFGANLGALTHFAGLELEMKSDGSRFRFAQIGGGAERYSELKGGHIDVTAFSTEEFLRFRSEGLRGLAILGEQRHPAAPEIPTARELGLDVQFGNVFYWWAPRGTPPDRLQVLTTALKLALETPAVRKRLAEMHCDSVFLSGTRLRDRLTATTRRMAGITLRTTTQPPNFPALVGGAILLVVPFVFARTMKERAHHVPAARPEMDGGGARPRWGTAAVCVLMTAGYAAALSSGGVGFRSATLMFVLLLGILLTEQLRRRLPIVVLSAVVMSFGLHYVFTQLFVVALP